MKRLFFAVFIALAALPFVLSLFACGSSAPANSNYAVTQQVPPAAAVPVVPAKPASPPAPVNPFYSGDGGRGTSLAILTPKTSGMEDADTVSTVIQGEFVSNFTTYTAISVLDRASLDAQYTELLSGYYDDDAEAGIDLGHLPPTDYLLNTNITKTESGYALQIGITKTADKMTFASYSGTCTMEDLDNLTAIRQASLDLIAKMGVEPSEKTKTELAGAAEEKHIDAQTALARGLNAQRSGTVVEALSRYIQANNYDPSLAEAASRLNILTANVTSGNIGEDVRNDLQWRDQWVARLREAVDYYTKYLSQPIPYSIVYDTHIRQGKIDYERRTVPLRVTLSVEPDYEWFSVITKVIGTVAHGLRATLRAGTWNIGLRRPREYFNAYYVTIEVVNDAGKTIGSETVSLPYGWWNVRGGIPSDLQELLDTEKTGYGRRPLTVSDVEPYHLVYPFKGSREVVFPAVDPNDITDSLSIRISAIDGMPAETAAAERNLTIVSDREYREFRHGKIQIQEWNTPISETGREVILEEGKAEEYRFSKWREGFHVMDFGYKIINNFSLMGEGNVSEPHGSVYPPSVTSITSLWFRQDRSDLNWLTLLPSSVKRIGALGNRYNDILIGAADATILPVDSLLAQAYNSNGKKPGYYEYIWDSDDKKASYVYSPCPYDAFDRR